MKGPSKTDRKVDVILVCYKKSLEVLEQEYGIVIILNCLFQNKVTSMTFLIGKAVEDLCRIKQVKFRY